MIEVICKTNLDLLNEVWPRFLPCVPRIGDYIESATKHETGFVLQLEVVSVTYKRKNDGNWIPHVELHMTRVQKSLRSRKEGAAHGSITAFYEWYGPAVGKSEHYFI